MLYYLGPFSIEFENGGELHELPTTEETLPQDGMDRQRATKFIQAFEKVLDVEGL
jgi:hypothetical protein